MNLAAWVFVFFSIAETHAHIPSYLKPCRRSDPKFDECCVKHGRETIPHILNGAKELKIPNLQPLNVQLFSIHVGKHLKLELHNVNIYGVESGLLKSMKHDFNKENATVLVHCKYLKFIGDYDIEGQIAVLPVQGSGVANITLDDVDFAFQYKWKIIKRHGTKYAEIFDPKLEYSAKRVYYHLENLFNGEKILGDGVNKFMNENWKEVDGDLKESMQEAMAQIVYSVALNFFLQNPFDELYPE